MALPVSLGHCLIHVSDWKHSNAFYSDVPGAEIVACGTGFAYRFGGQQLNCHGPDAIGHPVARLPVMPGNSSLCFVWPGTLAAACAHLECHGIIIELGPAERHGARGAGMSLYFRDPDGSLLEFICYQGLEAS